VERYYETNFSQSLTGMDCQTEPNNRILVIDDELGLREGCRRALTPHGYQVDVAATGQEGLTKALQGSFAVVLIDVMMPDVSGIELLAPILEHDPDTVCIIITGYATVELAVQAMKLGAYDFVAKPFSDDNLLLAVGRGLERRQLQQEARRSRQLEEEATRLAEEKAMLQELDRVKSAFMRTVAHELRAPIGAIRSFLTLILQGYSSPEKQRAMQERAAQRADGLLELIDDLLNLARLKDAERASNQELVHLDEVLEDILGLHRPEAEGKQIAFTVASDPCPPIVADPSHIEQLWTNLISNAIKYTPARGRIAVRLSSRDHTIVAQVEDSGIGIAEKDLPLIFQEFYRTEQAKTFAQHGTGLGMSIVKQIVRQYGGDIHVESKLEEGTQFTFWLPVGRSAPPG
jgi:two-component system sensor histidine kinase/response regulator